MNCKICHTPANHQFRAKILKNKYEVQYYLCPHCGFLQTEAPFWLTEAYESPINLSDTGLLRRNVKFAQKTAKIIFYLFNPNQKFLDFAGGYGIFVRLMRDAGFDFYWDDPYAANLLAKGFEYQGSNGQIALVTSFECFEHFVNPLDEIEKILKMSPNLLFSTHLLPVPVPAPNQWWYYALDHGQHISFYSKQTLDFIAQKFNVNFYTNHRNFHLFTRKKINPLVFRWLVTDTYLPYWLLTRFMASKTNQDARLMQG